MSSTAAGSAATHRYRPLLLAALAVNAGCPQLLDDDFQTHSMHAGSSAGATGAPAAGGAQGTGGASAGASPVGGASGSAAGAFAGGGAESAGSAGASGTPTCSAPAVAGPSGRCYLWGTESASWALARSRCQARGAGWDLMSIRSAADSAFLASWVTAEAWVGADDSDGSELWRWVDDGSEFWEGGGMGSVLNDLYVNWNANEPNGGGGHDCLRILPGALWADLDCGDSRTSVCEGPAE
jgi:hypothetical protein